MKRTAALIIALVLMLSCIAVPGMAEAAENPYYREYDFDFVWSTKGISKLKSKAASQQGTVETLTYETPAYAINAIMGTDYTITKSLSSRQL